MSASDYERKSHLKYEIFIENVLCKQAEKDVLLTISHVTMKPCCLLLPFILQIRASVKDPFKIPVFWSRNEIQIYTTDLVLDLLIG